MFQILILEYVRCRSVEVGKRTRVCCCNVPSYVWALYTTIGVFAFGCCCSQLLTDIAKYSIGRLRPHFLAICNPDWNQVCHTIRMRHSKGRGTPKAVE